MDKQEIFTMAQVAAFFGLTAWFWCCLMDAMTWSAW